MGLADLHLHTIYSYDGTATVSAVLRRAKELGLNVIAITDHDEVGVLCGRLRQRRFERALQIRRLAAELPAEAIVLETDAPDIPPHWLYRTAAERAAGRTSRNEPAELPRIARVLGGLRGWSDAETAAITRANVERVLPRWRA